MELTLDHIIKLKQLGGDKWAKKRKRKLQANHDALDFLRSEYKIESDVEIWKPEGIQSWILFKAFCWVQTLKQLDEATVEISINTDKLFVIASTDAKVTSTALLDKCIELAFKIKNNE